MSWLVVALRLVEHYSNPNLYCFADVLTSSFLCRLRVSARHRMHNHTMLTPKALNPTRNRVVSWSKQGKGIAKDIHCPEEVIIMRRDPQGLVKLAVARHSVLRAMWWFSSMNTL